MNRIRALAILNIISFLLHLSVTYMVQEKMVTSYDVGEISDMYPSLFTPAGFTFVIWGIIYTYLFVFCVFHIVRAYKRDAAHPANKDLARIGSLFIVNNLATAAWLLAWTKAYLLLSVILILVQLASLILIHARLQIHSTERSASSRLATEFPLSIYLGWISVATIANISSWLAAVQWGGLGIPAPAWLLIMISAAILLGIFMVFIRKNIAFGLVMCWGFFGIVSRLDSPGAHDYGYQVNLAWAGIAILAISSLIQAGISMVRKENK